MLWVTSRRQFGASRFATQHKTVKKKNKIKEKHSKKKIQQYMRR